MAIKSIIGIGAICAGTISCANIKQGSSRT